MAKPRGRIGTGAACAAFAAALAAPCAGLHAGPPAATSLFPAGGGRGQTVDATAAGTFDAWPVRVWVDEPGLEVEPAAEKGKFAIRVAADAAPGLRWVRFHDAEGASGLLPFEVGGVPGLVEAEPNDGPENYQALAQLPITVDGRFGKRGDVDGFAVELAAGQTLVASLKGHRLGSPMDAVLQLVSPAGFVVSQADDDAGLDPRIVFEAAEAGRYVVRGFAFPSEPNSTIGFAGGDTFVYRLTLTTGPFLDYAMPLVVSEADTTSEVETFGWNLTKEVGRLRAERVGTTDRARVWHPAIAEAAEFSVLPSRAVVEPPEGNGGLGTHAPPASVSGRIGSDGERDVYRVAGKKGQAWRVRVAARGLGSALDPVLRVSDAGGKTLAEEDDVGGTRDPETTFVLPEDGEYQVSVHDLTGRGGSRSYYLLEITEAMPDFRLGLGADRVVVLPGKSATLDVTVSRVGGFDRPVEITVVGLPEGVTAAPARDETMAKPEEGAGKGRKRGKNAEASTVTLTLTAPEGAAAFSGPVSVTGRAVGSEDTTERVALAPLPAPGAATGRVWLTVPAKSGE